MRRFVSLLLTVLILLLPVGTSVTTRRIKEGTTQALRILNPLCCPGSPSAPYPPQEVLGAQDVLGAHPHSLAKDQRPRPAVPTLPRPCHCSAGLGSRSWRRICAGPLAGHP